MVIRLKFNEDTDDVDFINDNGTVVDSVGAEVVQSWVEAYNAKHGYVKPEPVKEVTETDKVEGEEDDKKQEESGKED